MYAKTTSAWAALGIAATLAAHALGADQTSGTAVRWATGERQELAPMARPALRASLDALRTRGDGSHLLVRFARPLDAPTRAAAERAGLTLTTALGGTAYFGALRPDADPDALARAGLAYAAPIAPARKLHPDLLAGNVRSWAIAFDDVAGDAKLAALLADGSARASDLAAAGLDPTVAVVVLFHDDWDAHAAVDRLARRLGADPVSELVSISAATVRLPLSRVALLADDDAVMWVEPPLPAMTDLNAENRALTGVDTLNAVPYLLDGSGVRVLVFDGGQVYAHGDLASRLTIGASDTARVAYHATHVAGTIGGDGTAIYNNRGMAPGVQIISYGFEQQVPAPGFLYTDPGDIEADYAEAIGTYGVDIANNSIGTNTAPNGYPCEWTGNYGVTSAMIDAIVRGSLGAPFRVVWANGNERQTSRCLGDDNGLHGEYYSTAPPACAKNHITVGALNADTDAMTGFSSWGPTDDGRIKPDVSAPGCQVGGDGGVTSTTSSGPADYRVLCGTSMAAPTVTGICALVLEQWRITRPGEPDPMNATFKALLANTAVDRGNPGPDYQYGFGSVRAVAAVDAVIAGQVVQGEVAQGGVQRYAVTVPPGEPMLRITVAWDDVPGAPNVLPALVNDLDLRVLDPAGAEHLPWTLDPAHPEAPAERTRRDAVNNIEQVQLDAPAPGVYTIEVTGQGVAQGPVQRFGLVSTGQLRACSPAGTVSMNASVVLEAGTLAVTVRDCDLNADAGAVESVTVTIASTTDPAGSPLTLTETGPDTAAFAGLFTYGPASADLIAYDADELTATYVDADDGSGHTAVARTASARVDATPPVVLTPTVSGVWHDTATVAVDTDEPTTVTLAYGLSLDALNPLDLDLPAGTHHAFPLAGLAPDTAYRYVLTATDAAGNVTVSDADGAGHFFRTTVGPEPVATFLLDDTDPGWDTTGLWAFGQPTGNHGEPTSGATGNNVYAYNLDGWYQPNTPEEYLTSTPIDLTGVVEARLDFERWLGVEPDVAVGAAVQVRVGDGPWRDVWRHDEGRMAPDAWEHVSYDLAPFADASAGVQLRWVMGPTTSFADECGWNIDDIVVSGVVLARLCTADIDHNGALNLDDVNTFAHAFVAGLPPADLDGNGVLNLDDVNTFAQSFIQGCP